MAEIKELNEAKHKKDEAVTALALPSRRPLVPDMVLSYWDPAVHEDVHNIIKFSAEELLLSDELHGKVLQLLARFLYTFLRAPACGNRTEEEGNGRDGEGGRQGEEGDATPGDGEGDVLEGGGALKR